MRRQFLHALTTSIYPLLGLAGLMAMSGCAAVPAISMATSLMKPAQPAQSAAPTPSPDIFSGLAQRLGISLPGQPAANPAAQPATTPATTSDATTTAAK